MTAPLVYLDNNATTRPDPRVVEALLPLLTEHYANPSSTHRAGREVAERVAAARHSVAALLGARHEEIVFTSGGTEADNAALRGVLAAQPGKRHVIISTVEHHAIFETAEQLEQEGVAVTRAGVDAQGRLDLDAVARAVRPDTGLISIMLANNETGVILAVKEVVRLAKAHGVPVHTDAVNALGKMPVGVDHLGVSLLSLSAHKIYGPKGVGALYIRNGTPFRQWQVGGGQERGRRGGTHNAPGIVGLGAACRILGEQDAAALDRLAALRDRLETEIQRRIPGAVVVGRDAPRLPNTSCVCFEGVLGHQLVGALSEAGVCVSSGAACTSDRAEPSHVLRAMGIAPQTALGEVRFSLGRFNSDADVSRLLDVLPTAIERARASDLCAP